MQRRPVYFETAAPLQSLTDTFAYPDPRWLGATWSGGVNTPTLGGELLTDGGLENWTSATNTKPSKTSSLN